MASEESMRMEEIGNGQQEMQEKIAQMTKIVANLTKGKRITNDLSLQRKLTSGKGNLDLFIMPNLNNPCE